MARPTKKRPTGKKESSAAPQLLKSDAPAVKADSDVHVFGTGIRCDTEPRGHATPQGPIAPRDRRRRVRGIYPAVGQGHDAAVAVPRAVP